MTSKSVPNKTINLIDKLSYNFVYPFLEFGAINNTCINCLNKIYILLLLVRG